jgi:hypothetical protein
MNVKRKKDASSNYFWNGRGRVKENGGGDEFKCDIFDTL